MARYVKLTDIDRASLFFPLLLLLRLLLSLLRLYDLAELNPEIGT